MIFEFERVAVAWSRRLALLAGLLLVALALATVLDALLRYALARPIPGTFEATELLLAVIIFSALPYTNVTDGHVSVDFLTQRLGARAQYAVIAVNAVVTAALLALVTAQMIGLADEFWRTSRTTITARIPVFPFLAVVTVAAALSVVAFLVAAIGAARRVISPDLPPPPGIRMDAAARP
ncbi:MAG: TRAP transporter small permease [Candidatus Rokubacteria bacterium]|nr:TRAP transporter small permease [Candidatus Rokubacteria bacterium]